MVREICRVLALATATSNVYVLVDLACLRAWSMQFRYGFPFTAIHRQPPTQHPVMALTLLCFLGQVRQLRMRLQR